MQHRWNRKIVEKVVSSVLDCESEQSVMRVASWKAPREISPDDELTLTLDLISQVEEGPSGGHFISHTYRLRVLHDVLTAAIEVPAALVEDALAKGDCVITAVIVANEENIKAVSQTARPLAMKINEIAQLHEQADVGMSVAEKEGGRIARSPRKRPKRL